MTVDELCGKYNIPRNLIQAYMELCAGGDCCGKRRLEMLDEKRKAVLDVIHLKEQQMEKLDYLRYKIRRELKQD